MHLIRHIFLITVPTLAVLFLLLEVLLRAVGYVPYYMNGNAFVPSQNQTILYVPRPNFEGLYAGIRVSVNSQGFRGRELAQEGTSVFRVALIGDSVAFGQGVEEEETLPAQLTVRLQRKLNSQVEVVNLGVPGYDTCQEYLRFEESVAKLKPQTAILVYLDNDTEPSLITVIDGVVISSDVRTRLFGDLRVAARKYSYAYNLVWTNLQVFNRELSGVNAYSSAVTQRFSEDYPGWRRSKACFAALVSLTRRKSIRLIVIPFPPMAGLRDTPYPFDRYIRAVCNEAHAAGVECLNVVPALQDPRLRLYVSNIEMHPSAEVYAKVAEQIEKILP